MRQAYTVEYDPFRFVDCFGGFFLPLTFHLSEIPAFHHRLSQPQDIQSFCALFPPALRNVNEISGHLNTDCSIQNKLLLDLNCLEEGLEGEHSADVELF